MSNSRKIKAVIEEVAGVDEAELTNDASLTEDLGIDELDIVELVMALEKEFDIEIEDPDGDSWKTVGDIIKYIDKKAK